MSPGPLENLLPAARLTLVLFLCAGLFLQGKLKLDTCKIEFVHAAGLAEFSEGRRQVTLANGEMPLDLGERFLQRTETRPVRVRRLFACLLDTFFFGIVQLRALLAFLTLPLFLPGPIPLDLLPFRILRPLSRPPTLSLDFIKTIAKVNENGNPILRVLPANIGHAQVPQSLHLLFLELGRRQVVRPRKLDQLAPELKPVEYLEETATAVLGARPPLGERVVFRMPRKLDHVPGQAGCLADPADIHQVANEPLIVVREVVDLVRQHQVFHHVRVVDPGRGLLLPGGIVVALELGENMPAHMPHMGDRGRGLAAAARSGKSALRLFIIPEMNPVMMRRMHRRLLQDLIDEAVHGHVAGDRHAAPGALPCMADEKGPRLDILRVLLDDAIQRLEIVLAALFFAIAFLAAGLAFLRARIHELFQSIDIHAPTLTRPLLKLDGLVDEITRALFVIRIRHRHTPIADGQLRIQRRRLPEAPLGLKIPEAVKLTDALVDKGLGLLILGGDGKDYIARAPHQVGTLPRPLVESLPVIRMALGHLLGSLLPLCGLLGGDRRTMEQDQRDEERKTEHYNETCERGCF